jgi:hypothetical protein
MGLIRSNVALSVLIELFNSVPRPDGRGYFLLALRAFAISGW